MDGQYGRLPGLINANHRQVSFWLSTYEKYGNLRPARKHGSYSADFKRKVVF